MAGAVCAGKDPSSVLKHKLRQAESPAFSHWQPQRNGALVAGKCESPWCKILKRATTMSEETTQDVAQPVRITISLLEACYVYDTGFKSFLKMQVSLKKKKAFKIVLSRPFTLYLTLSFGFQKIKDSHLCQITKVTIGLSRPSWQLARASCHFVLAHPAAKPVDSGSSHHLQPAVLVWAELVLEFVALSPEGISDKGPPGSIRGASNLLGLKCPKMPLELFKNPS